MSGIGVGGGAQVAPSGDVEQLAKIIAAGIGARSRWALNTAAEAAGTEGIGGVLVLKISPKAQEFVDVSFTIGLAEIVHRWVS